MAKVINPDGIPRRRPGAQPKYPWEQWLDGQWREAVEGEDYDVSTRSFQTALYYQARKRGLKIETHITENGMAFRFSEKGEEIK